MAHGSTRRAARRFPCTIRQRERTLGTVPAFDAAATEKAVAAAHAAFPAWAAKTAKERAVLLRRWNDLILLNVGRPREAHDRRAGQAARGIEGRDRLCRLLRRVVRGGSQARLRRRDPGPPGRQAHPRAAPAGRRRRRDHALELPGGDDHAQGRAGARRRLHRRLQAGDPDALLRARARRARASRRHPGRRPQRHHRPRARNRRRAHRAMRACASFRSPARPRSASS